MRYLRLLPVLLIFALPFALHTATAQTIQCDSATINQAVIDVTAILDALDASDPAAALADVGSAEAALSALRAQCGDISPGQLATVTRVIDGDTLEVGIEGTVARVRYIGMNTPETDEPCGSEATAANSTLVAGQTVTMFRDVSETDRFDRLLRYVYVGGVFVNAALVRDGWAEAAEFPPDTRFASLFADLQSQASAGNLGCHAMGAFGGDTAVTTRPETWYVSAGGAVNARSCASISCGVVTQFQQGAALTVTGAEDGDAVSGNTLWRRIESGGQTVYVHSSLLSQTRPAPLISTQPPAQPQPDTSAPQPAPTQAPPPPPPASACDCFSGNTLNCSNFSSHNQAQACFQQCINQGVGDVHDLDRDGDGLACESLP